MTMVRTSATLPIIHVHQAPASRRCAQRAATSAVALLVGTLALLACSAATAGAEVVLDQAIHKRFGVVPTVSRANRAAASAPFGGGTCNADGGDCTALSYNGGPVQHGETDYLLFWTPAGYSAPNEYVSGIQTWLDEVAGADYTQGNPFAIDQQYYDLSGPGGTKSFVPYGIVDGGAFIDTDTYPTSGCTDTDGGGKSMSVCLTSEQITTELSSYIAAHSLPTGIDVEYFVLTPQHVGSCFDSSSTECSYTRYCGYHDFTGSGQTQIVYADMPWAYEVPGCDVNEAFGAGYPNSNYIDPVVSVFSHELSETMTDPNLNAWFQDGGTDGGYEIGDKCAYIYGSSGYGSTGGLSNNGSGYWNVGLASNVYLMQLEFDNRSANCALEDTDTQPAVSVSISPPLPVRESQATFTANVTDPAGVSSVQWSFGDGTSASGSAVHHTYATLGAKTLTALVTDEHGNERQLTEKIIVTDVPPTASFGVSSSSPTAGQAVSFDGSASSDPEGTIAGYSWSWGDGSAAGSGATPTHTYATAGTYTVTLTVTDTTGASGQLSREVTVAAASGGTGESGAGGSSTALVTAPNPSATTTVKGTSAKTARKARPRCITVTRRLHGHKRKVRICRPAKPRAKAKKTRRTHA